MRRFLMLCLFVLSGTLSASDPTPLIRGRFDLRDCRTGKQSSQATFDGSYRLVFFGFTHCPLTCPLGLRTVDGILKQLGKDSAQVKALFITIDPKRDSAEVMAKYLNNHDPRIIGLVGSDKAIASAMRNFRLEAERMGQGDSYVLEHPAIIYLMNRKGSYLTTLPSNGDAVEITKTVKKWAKL